MYRMRPLTEPYVRLVHSHHCPAPQHTAMLLPMVDRLVTTTATGDLHVWCFHAFRRSWETVDLTLYAKVVLHLHTAHIPALAFMPEVGLLATGSLDATVGLWGVVAMPDGVGGRRGVHDEGLDMTVFESADLNGDALFLVRHLARFRTGGVRALAYVPSARVLAVAGFEGDIHVFDVQINAGLLLFTLSGHATHVAALCVLEPPGTPPSFSHDTGDGGGGGGGRAGGGSHGGGGSSSDGVHTSQLVSVDEHWSLIWWNVCRDGALEGAARRLQRVSLADYRINPRMVGSLTGLVAVGRPPRPQHPSADSTTAASGAPPGTASGEPVVVSDIASSLFQYTRRNASAPLHLQRAARDATFRMPVSTALTRSSPLWQATHNAAGGLRSRVSRTDVLTGPPPPPPSSLPPLPTPTSPYAVPAGTPAQLPSVGGGEVEGSGRRRRRLATQQLLATGIAWHGFAFAFRHQRPTQVAAMTCVPATGTLLLAARRSVISLSVFTGRRRARTLTALPAPVSTPTVASCATGARLVLGCNDGGVVVLNAASGGLLRTLAGHEGGAAVNGVAMAGRDGAVASVGDDGALMVQHEQPGLVAESVARAAVTGTPPTAVLWTAVNAHAAGQALTAVDVAAGWDVIATGDAQGGIRLWHLLHATLLAELRGHDAEIMHLSFVPAPFTTLLVSVDAVGGVVVWDAAGGCALAATAIDMVASAALLPTDPRGTLADAITAATVVATVDDVTGDLSGLQVWCGTACGFIHVVATTPDLPLPGRPATPAAPPSRGGRPFTPPPPATGLPVAPGHRFPPSMWQHVVDGGHATPRHHGMFRPGCYPRHGVAVVDAAARECGTTLLRRLPVWRAAGRVRPGIAGSAPRWEAAAIMSLYALPPSLWRSSQQPVVVCSGTDGAVLALSADGVAHGRLLVSLPTMGLPPVVPPPESTPPAAAAPRVGRGEAFTPTSPASAANKLAPLQLRVSSRAAVVAAAEEALGARSPVPAPLSPPSGPRPSLLRPTTLSPMYVSVRGANDDLATVPLILMPEGAWWAGNPDAEEAHGLAGRVAAERLLFELRSSILAAARSPPAPPSRQHAVVRGMAASFTATSPTTPARVQSVLCELHRTRERHASSADDGSDGDGSAHSDGGALRPRSRAAPPPSRGGPASPPLRGGGTTGGRQSPPPGPAARAGSPAPSPRALSRQATRAGRRLDGLLTDTSEAAAAGAAAGGTTTDEHHGGDVPTSAAVIALFERACRCKMRAHVPAAAPAAAAAYGGGGVATPAWGSADGGVAPRLRGLPQTIQRAFHSMAPEVMEAVTATLSESGLAIGGGKGSGRRPGEIRSLQHAAMLAMEQQRGMAGGGRGGPPVVAGGSPAAAAGDDRHVTTFLSAAQRDAFAGAPGLRTMALGLAAEAAERPARPPSHHSHRSVSTTTAPGSPISAPPGIPGGGAAAPTSETAPPKHGGGVPDRLPRRQPSLRRVESRGAASWHSRGGVTSAAGPVAPPVGARHISPAMDPVRYLDLTQSDWIGGELRVDVEVVSTLVRAVDPDATGWITFAALMRHLRADSRFTYMGRQIEMLFRSADRHSRGMLTLREIIQVLFAAATPTQVTEIEGYVAYAGPSPDELRIAYVRHDATIMDLLRSMFTSFDVDGSGSLTETELRVAMGTLQRTMRTAADGKSSADDLITHEAAVSSILAGIDLSGDGEISFDEFVDAVGPHIAAGRM